VISTIGWGVAIGVAALAATLVAQWLLRCFKDLPSSVQMVSAFVLAFVVYQSSLYAAAVSILGGTAAFAPGIIAQVVGVNVVALGGLWGLSELLTAASYRRRASASPARFA
jgi:hypothetical protein